MMKIFTIVLLVGCIGLGNCEDPDTAADVAAPKPPCSCILPVVVLPGGGLLPGGLLPGGLSINLLNNLLQGGLLNNSNLNLSLLKLILANPAFLNIPGVINLLTNAAPAAPGAPAAPAAPAGGSSVSGLLNNLLQYGLLNNFAGPSSGLPTGNVDGVLNNAVQGGVLNNYGQLPPSLLPFFPFSSITNSDFGVNLLNRNSLLSDNSLKLL